MMMTYGFDDAVAEVCDELAGDDAEARRVVSESVRLFAGDFADLAGTADGERDEGELEDLLEDIREEARASLKAFGML